MRIRKARRRVELEGLESRTLLATLPAAVTSGALHELTGFVDVTKQGNAMSPTVAVNPANSKDLVAVWGVDISTLSPVPHTTAIFEGAYSTDGGSSWNGFDPMDPILDAATIDATPPTDYTQVTDPSVAFDSQGNLYVLALQTSGATDGAVTLSRFNFSAGGLQTNYLDHVVYQWLTSSDAAYSPTLAVDSAPVNPPSDVTADPHAGNVYVAWASGDIHPANPNVLLPYNPHRIEVLVSSDGGGTFSGATIASSDGNFGPQQNAHPDLAIDQSDSGRVSVGWEDFGTGATATPPFSIMHANSMPAGDSYGIGGATGPIAPGVAPAGGGDHIPATTSFSVTVPNLAAVTGLTVTLGMYHPSVQDLRIVLVAPSGASIVLLNNQVNAAGTSNTGTGLNGAQLGVFGAAFNNGAVTNPGVHIGTVFDDNATRDIFDSTTTGTNGVAAPAVGHYQPEGGSLASLLSSGSVNGTWTLKITDFRADASTSQPSTLTDFRLQFTTGMTAGTPSFLSSFGVTGSITDNYPTAAPSTPSGLGPGLVMTSDTTLGPGSPYQGRIYAAFVGYLPLEFPAGVRNPRTNTDIFLVYSKDGGRNWSDPVEVNDDFARRDGYSQANEALVPAQPDGRSQFQPEVAVDPTTGTLVVSWRDARNDAANARVATYIATSIDGGQTFSPEVYANPSQTAVDAITGQAVVMGPQGDNQGSANGQRDSGFGYGPQMGLAVFDGQIAPIWAGNLNRAYYNGTAIVAFPLNIWYQPMAIAAGPRVINSTMGPIPLAEAASGSVSISVTFDRPVDPATFTAGDVQVFHHDTTNGDPSVQLLVTGVAPVLSSGSNQFGYTQFTVTFNPSKKPGGSASGIANLTGTYSYLIAPDNGSGTAIASPIWSFIDGTLRKGAPMDQNADGAPDQNPLKTAFTGTTPGDVYAVPMPQPTTLTTFSAANILSGPFDQNTLPMIVPGPQVASTQAVGGNGPSTGADNLLMNDTTSQFKVTFDRPMQVSTFTSDQVLSIIGPVGPITGPLPFASDAIAQSIPAASSSGPGVLTVPLTIPSSNKTFKVAKVTVGLNIAFQTDSALTAVLIAPDGTRVPLFSGVGGSGANFVNTVLDDSATTNPISGGSAPFTGTFRPEYPLNSTITLSSLQGKFADGTWKLEITNINSGTTGVLSNWSLNITPMITVTPVSPSNGLATSFNIDFPMQQLSGSYAIQLGPNILDQFGDAVDTNKNAGLDVLRGQGQNSPTTTVQYTASGLPKAVPAPSGSTPGEVTSTITVPDSFIVQGDTTTSGISGLRVQLSLSHPNDPDLTATLYYNRGGPGEVAVTLFSGVGSGASKANFSNTVFDDRAGTPIQTGTAPFFATFNPQMPLSAFAGLNAKGSWTLVITNSATGSGATGTLNSWSLSFQKPLPTSGLGEPNGDDISTGFRIFTLGQADALSAQAWTPVGSAAIGSGSAGGASGGETSAAGGAGRVSGLVIDPSDPSGNTVYAAGASGGVWKTTNFLTTAGGGPTWIPLTDLGPTTAINIGGLAVFPRNHDPNQTIIIAATGEGNTGTPGVGFLISMDGGRTWTLDDSKVNVDSAGNPLPITTTDPTLTRDRTFVGTTAFKVAVDPQLTPDGQVIIYAALSGTNGGIWRSEDTGKTWTNMLPGQATDVVLDPNSGIVLNPSTQTQVQGNLQVVYAAFSGQNRGQGDAAQGVYMSPNQGQVWSQMLGTTGNPLIFDSFTFANKNVNPAAGPTPNGGGGRIALAVPQPTGNAAQDPIFSGWLYAAASGGDGSFAGLFLTKDFGQNWTEVHIPTLPPVAPVAQAVPTNDVTKPNYTITGGGQFDPQGNYDLTLTVDPTNPNIVYLGGSRDGGQTGLVRVDATTLWDAHSLVPFSNIANDGALDLNSTGPATVDDNTKIIFSLAPELDQTPYLNFIRNPFAPFVASPTLETFNLAAFTNNGAGVKWIPFDMGGTDYHAVATMVDPTTGLPRLIFGNDQGVWSVLDNGGTFESKIGASDSLPGINRNGNLQITQFYYGAVQPSIAAALKAAALFYGSAQDNGGPVSDPNILSNGNITWSGPGGDAAGVGTDQQGAGTAYQFFWPCCGPQFQPTDFFQFIPKGLSGTGDYIARTFGLLQQSGALPTPDPQWPFEGGANFDVNPVNSSDVVISSSTGNIFATSDQGVTWFDIGQPSVFNGPGTWSVALTYGAPDPNAPAGIGNLGNFIYVGTAKGEIYITQNGGGSGTSNSWINVSTGLDGSRVLQIITDPVRGSHDAYAVTATGVFHIDDSVPSASNPTPTWTDITGNIHNLAYSILGQAYDPTTDTNSTKYNQASASGLAAIAADWRYSIPNDPTDPSKGYHPVLYVAGDSGVYQSLDNGKTWALFPQTTFGAVAAGGYLPHVRVNSLSLSLGNVDVNTGRPDLAGPYNPSNPTAKPDPDLMMAATYGRGEFAINLAPILFPSSVAFASSSTSGTAADGTPIVNTAKPTIDGLSAITGFGNATWVTIVDETPGDPTFGQIIGGFDPSKLTAGQPIALGSGNATNALGNFAIPITKAFGTNGLKTIKVYTTDDAGSQSNPVTLKFTLQATDIVTPPPTAPPAAPTLAIDSSVNVVNGVPVTKLTNVTFNGTTAIGTSVTITEVWTDAPGGAKTNTFTLPASDIASDGSFSFQFQDFTDSSNNPVISGTFNVSAAASWINNPNHVAASPSSPVVTFKIDNTTPAAVTDFRLDPGSDTGIVGDNVTSDRKPMFIGTTTPGNTVELFVNGQPAVQTTATASSTTFSIQLPYSLTNGQVSLYVEVINGAGNVSGPSNPVAPPFTGMLTSGSATVTGIANLNGLAVGNSISGAGIPPGTTILSINRTAGSIALSAAATASGSQGLVAYQAVGVAIVSNAADYNGGPASDRALFTRNTASNLLQWLVQTPANSAPPWFGPGGVLYTPSTISTGTLTSGSALVTGIGTTMGLAVGANVTGTGIPAGTTIKAINNATSITLSANATASGSKSLTITGPANVVPFEGDFDGDGLTDLATYNLATATWTIVESSNYSVQGAKTFTLGTANSSLPVVGHFDPNGPSEEAVFTVNAQGQGVWSIASVLTGIRTFTFGQAGDVPLAGAFDALGYDEPAVYRPSTGQFLVLNPTNSQTETLTIPGISSSPDLSSLVPVPGQYDNSKPAAGKTLPAFGRTEPAVFDPKTGVFTILGPGGKYTVSGFQPGDIPAPADYLGLGSDQVAAFRPSSGQFVGRGSNGQLTTLATLGQSGDIPITAPLVYRVPSNTTLISTPTPTPTTPTPTPTTPTPTPTTPTPTPTTPTPTPTTPTPTSTTPTPTSTSQVTVSSVQLVTNRRHQVTEILVGFSGALNAAEAQDLGIYHLTVAGKHGSFTAKNARSIKLKGVVYNPANDTVALFTRRPFALKKKVQLLVDGTPPSGLEDSQGRPINGGRNPVAVLSRGGVSLAAVAFGPTGAANGGVSAAMVDVLMELNALAGATLSQQPGRKRQ